jgi:hypothetical protein
MSGMTCSEFENVIVEAVRVEVADAVVRRKAFDHAAVCERCARRLRAEQRLGEVLSTIAVQDEALNAPPAVEKILLAALREQTVGEKNAGWTWTRGLVFGSLAAGVVLMVLFLTQAYRGGERTRERQTADVSRTPSRGGPSPEAPVRTQMLAPVYREPRKRVVRMQQATRHKKAPQQDADRQPPEIVTDFMPVVYDPTPIERGRLVRIQLPRSAMVAFGLPMNEDRANEPVKADVLLDEQDEARAVRFVR